MEIASLLLAIAKAFPAAEKIFSRVIELYYAKQGSDDQNNTNEIQLKRDAIIASLKQPGLTDENRASLRHLLYDLHRGIMRQETRTTGRSFVHISGTVP